MTRRNLVVLVVVVVLLLVAGIALTVALWAGGSDEPRAAMSF